MKNLANDDFDFVFSFEEKADEAVDQINFEAATKAEISDVLKAFKQRAKDEALAKEQNTSTEYWFAVYFANQEQRDFFLKAIKVLDLLEDQYIDGMTFAEALKVEVPRLEINTPKSFRRPAGVDDLVMEF